MGGVEAAGEGGGRERARRGERKIIDDRDSGRNEDGARPYANMLYAQARSLVTTRQNRRIVRQQGFCLFYGVPRASTSRSRADRGGTGGGRAESSEIYSQLNVVRIRAPGVPNYCFPDIRPPPGCRSD